MVQEMKTTRYSLKLAKLICDLLEQGHTLSRICKENKAVLPTERTVYRWRRDIDAFRTMYDTARETQIYKMQDEMMDLVDSPLPDIDCKIKLNAELQQRRLKVDALKFAIAKGTGAMKDKLIHIKHSGEVSGPNIVVTNYSTPIPEVIEDDGDKLH